MWCAFWCCWCRFFPAQSFSKAIVNRFPLSTPILIFTPVIGLIPTLLLGSHKNVQIRCPSSCQSTKSVFKLVPQITGFQSRSLKHCQEAHDCYLFIYVFILEFNFNVDNPLYQYALASLTGVLNWFHPNLDSFKSNRL